MTDKMRTKFSNKWGLWRITKGKNCNIEVLTEPSLAFRQYQEAQPEPLPERNLMAEIDELRNENTDIKARLDKITKVNGVA